MVHDVVCCGDAGTVGAQMGWNSSRRMQLQEQAFRVNAGLQVWPLPESENDTGGPPLKYSGRSIDETHVNISSTVHHVGARRYYYILLAVCPED